MPWQPSTYEEQNSVHSSMQVSKSALNDSSLIVLGLFTSCPMPLRLPSQSPSAPPNTISTNTNTDTNHPLAYLMSILDEVLDKIEGMDLEMNVLSELSHDQISTERD